MLCETKENADSVFIPSNPHIIQFGRTDIFGPEEQSLKIIYNMYGDFVHAEFTKNEDGRCSTTQIETLCGLNQVPAMLRHITLSSDPGIPYYYRTGSRVDGSTREELVIYSDKERDDVIYAEYKKFLNGNIVTQVHLAVDEMEQELQEPIGEDFFEKTNQSSRMLIPNTKQATYCRIAVMGFPESWKQLTIFFGENDQIIEIQCVVCSGTKCQVKTVLKSTMNPPTKKLYKEALRSPKQPLKINA